MRIIKPSFFTNDELADLRPIVRLLFIGLWTVADRAGRLEGRPKKIKAELMPFDNLDVQKAISEIEALGLLMRYEVDGRKYIQITNFEKHQHPHPKEVASVMPDPKAAEKNGSTGFSNGETCASPSLPSFPSGPSGPSGSSEASPMHGGDEPFTTPEAKTALEGWLTLNRERRTPLAKSQRIALSARLREMGHDRAVAALIHSTAAGYRAIYEPTQVSTGPPVRSRARAEWRDKTIEEKALILLPDEPTEAGDDTG